MPLPHLTPILPLASEGAILPLAGGKGANLARLAQAGLPVPDGFTITTQAYHAFAGRQRPDRADPGSSVNRIARNAGPV